MFGESIKSCYFCTQIFRYKYFRAKMATISPLYKFRVFNFEDVMREAGLSHAGASTAISRWESQGVLKPIRRNMYTTIDPATEAPMCDKYELSSKISSTSYVGWHTALEFHGVAHQPFYNVYVGSSSRFKNFNFEGIDYEYFSAPFEPTLENGVIRPIGNPYVRVTNLERTVVDCCDRIERTGGIEELLHCIEGISMLDESKLEKYLALYNKAYLYQKVGFILEYSQEYHNVSNSFIEMCRAKGALHTKHLTTTGDSDTYVCRWKLYVPKNCVTEKNTDYEFV